MIFALIVAGLAFAEPAAPIPFQQAAVKPKPLKEPERVDISAARALGHNGTVILSGTIGADGVIRDITVKESSRSPLLDEAAKTELSRTPFAPAKDAQGAAIATTATFPFTYEGDGIDAGGWLARYRCDQFVKDVTWWTSAHPEKTDRDYRLYHILTGVRVLSNPNGMAAGLKESVTQSRAEWANAMTRCAATPDKLMIDYLPTADAIRRLSKIKG